MRLTLDFEAGLLVYRLAQTDRHGKVKETVAEVPGLFGECTLAACFGGKSQRLTVHSCKLDQGERGDVARRGDAFGLEDRVAPLTLEASSNQVSLAEQEAAIASTLG